MEGGFTSADTTEARQIKGATPIALRRHKRRASRNRSLALIDGLAGNDTLNGASGEHDNVQATVEDVRNEADAIRTLYLKGLDRQWTVTRDLDWSWQIDPAILGNGLPMGGIPLHLTKFWGTLSDELRTGISLRSTGFTLSNFLQPRTLRRRP